MPPLSEFAGVKAGALRERIEVQRRGPDTDNGIEVVEGDYATIFSIWADWQPRAGTEIFENMGREAKAGGYFFVRQSTDSEGITATDRIVWDSRTYGVVANDYHDETKRRIAVTTDDEG